MVAVTWSRLASQPVLQGPSSGYHRHRIGAASGPRIQAPTTGLRKWPSSGPTGAGSSGPMSSPR
eukprot:11199650-Lingulodinium_polyedra.AAC.1